MIEQIDQWDKNLMLWLNSRHLPWLDVVMEAASHKHFWIPLYIGLVAWMVWKERWQTVYLLVAIALVITVADRFTSGFTSSHAANVFGLAAFFWTLFGRYSRAFAWLFPWAVLVSYSRIYLGVHYPSDITVGALVGILSGWGIAVLWLWLQPKLPPAYRFFRREKSRA
jgi:undecaprenyl-diphosphatase